MREIESRCAEERATSVCLCTVAEEHHDDRPVENYEECSREILHQGGDANFNEKLHEVIDPLNRVQCRGAALRPQ